MWMSNSYWYVKNNEPDFDEEYAFEYIRTKELLDSIHPNSNAKIDPDADFIAYVRRSRPHEGNSFFNIEALKDCLRNITPTANYVIGNPIVVNDTRKRITYAYLPLTIEIDE